jgi:predicted transcriptional regulator
MQMTPFKTPDELTPAGASLLELLRRSPDQWHTRQQIADKLGRRRITPYDLAQLDYLIEAGLIEAHEGQRGAHGTRWEYKAKEAQ